MGQTQKYGMVKLINGMLSLHIDCLDLQWTNIIKPHTSLL